MTTTNVKKRSIKLNKKKFFVFTLLLLLVISLIIFFPKRYLHLGYLQENLNTIHHLVDQNLTSSVLIYIGLYFLVSVFAIPAAAVLTLLSGALFGFSLGFIATTIGSTLGAVGAFLVTRFLIGEYIAHKFFHHSKKIREEFEKNGDSYLLTLRIVPIFPFFMVNLLMGLTPIKFKNYIIISFFGMMPASAVYTYAGLSFAQLTSIEGILTPPIFLAFTLLGLLPHFGRFFLWQYRRHRTYKSFNKPKTLDYNIAIIGGGSAGLVTANISSSLGSKVLLIEKNIMGGECLNTGCVPSKSLIHFARLAKQGVKVDFDFVMKDIQKTIVKIAPNDSKERYESLGVECLRGEAKLVSPWEVSVNNKIIRARNIVIATGSSPVKLNVPGIDLINPLTSDSIWKLQSKPETLLVIGGGIVGCELSQAFARLGCKVIMLIRGERLLADEEEMISKEIQKSLVDDGVTIITNSTVEFFELKENKKIVHYIMGNQSKSLPFDELLVAVGRKANSHSLGDILKFERNEDETLKTNSYLQTNYPNIFACGDVAGPFQLTHFASHQAKYVSINILLGGIFKFKPTKNIIPRCIYTSPEVAIAGLTKSDADERGVPFDEVLFPMKDLDRAVIEKEESGFVQILTRKNSSQIIGATIVSANASLMIQEFVMAIDNKLTLDSILQSVHPYPGFNEANKYAASLWKKAQLTPKKAVWLSRFNRFLLKWW